VCQSILHRDVTVTLYSIDKHAVYATVSYANRDVGLELLKMGLGWYVPWSGAKTPLAEAYRCGVCCRDRACADVHAVRRVRRRRRQARDTGRCRLRRQWHNRHPHRCVRISVRARVVTVSLPLSGQRGERYGRCCHLVDIDVVIDVVVGHVWQRCQASAGRVSSESAAVCLVI
jgi:hypothetical protein